MKIGQEVILDASKIEGYSCLKQFRFVVVGFVSENLIDEMVDVRVIEHPAFTRFSNSRSEKHEYTIDDFENCKELRGLLHRPYDVIKTEYEEYCKERSTNGRGGLPQSFVWFLTVYTGHKLPEIKHTVKLSSGDQIRANELVGTRYLFAESSLR